MSRPLSQHLSVGLDEAACDRCGGAGSVHVPRGNPFDRVDTEPCPACHGAGVPPTDRIEDPHLRARLVRLLQHHPDWRSVLAEALPEARVAGEWYTEHNESRRYGGDRRVVAVVDWSTRSTWCRVEVLGVTHPAVEGAAEARAWCDEQLRAMGWVLV